MSYTITPAKLQDLNVLIDIGGHIPSKVSDALAALQVAQANGDTAGAKVAFDTAVAANITNGKAYSQLQGWHDSVKGSGPGPTPTPPPYSPPWANPVGSGGTIRFTKVWGDPTRIESGPFPPDGCVSVAFTTPAVVPPGGWAQVGEYQGAPAFRDMVLSLNEADFTNVLARDNSGVTPAINFPALAPNTTYYINVRNYYSSLPDGGCSCTNGFACPLLVQFNWP